MDFSLFFGGTIGNDSLSDINGVFGNFLAVEQEREMSVSNIREREKERETYQFQQINFSHSMRSWQKFP